MIAFYKGNIHDIDHFIKVWSYAKTIGELEGLDAHTQEVLELAAVIHDISCPLCREKYGNAPGKLQEQESPPLVAEFFEGLPVAKEDVERISWLAAHHHTYTDVDGLDHRILLEADYIVNAAENSLPRASTERMSPRLARLSSSGKFPPARIDREREENRLPHRVRNPSARLHFS